MTRKRESSVPTLTLSHYVTQDQILNSPQEPSILSHTIDIMMSAPS